MECIRTRECTFAYHFNKTKWKLKKSGMLKYPFLRTTNVQFDFQSTINTNTTYSEEKVIIFFWKIVCDPELRFEEAKRNHILMMIMMILLFFFYTIVVVGQNLKQTEKHPYKYIYYIFVIAYIIKAKNRNRIVTSKITKSHRKV